jgi:preflagellin peptidase FlaK
MMKEVLEALRILTSLAVLTYASWSDYKTREVSNRVWIVFAPLAFALTFSTLYLYEPLNALLFYGLSFGLTAAFAIIVFYAGGFGGADAKALMCLALALPFYPENLPSYLPISQQVSPISTMIFPITVFSNAVVLVIVLIAYILVRNLYWRQKTGRKLFEGDQKTEAFWRKLLVLITSYKVSVDKLKEKWHLYPLEDIEENESGSKRKLVIISRDENRNTTVDRLAKAFETGKIQDGIWTSPGLPMLVLITAGLVTALFYGDLVWIFVRLLLG